VSTPIKLGVIGCGRMLSAHLHGLKALRDAGWDRFRIVALCDTDQAAAESFRKKGEGPAPRPPVSTAPGDPLALPHLYVSEVHEDVLPDIYQDYETMLGEADIDACLVLTPHFLHHPIAVAALEAGKHVLVEKPTAVSVRAAQRMVEAAERTGRVLAVAENARYHLSTRAVRWVIEEGLVGDVQMTLSVQIGNPVWGPDKIAAETPWRHQKLLGGAGAAGDMGPHFFNRLRYWAGEIDQLYGIARGFEPVRVTRDEAGEVVQEVANEVDDAFFATWTYESGAVGQVSYAWSGHGKPVGLAGGQAIFGTRGNISGGQVHLDDGTVAPVTVLFQSEAPPELQQGFFPLGLEGAVALEHHEFQAAILEGRQAETSGQEGLRDLACSYAVVESSVLGAPVKLADVVSGAVDAYQREIDEHYGL